MAHEKERLETLGKRRKPVNMRKLEAVVRDMLQQLGCNLDDENLRETPKRVAKMYVDLTAGMDLRDFEKMKTIFKKACTLAGECHNMITLGGPFHSLCAHHLLPFKGVYVLSYTPNKHIVGASKVQRLVDFHSARPQGQEFLAHDIAATFTEVVHPSGVAIWLAGKHGCMELRGIEKEGTWLENRGEFEQDPVLRAEFSAVIQRGRPSLE